MRRTGWARSRPRWGLACSGRVLDEYGLEMPSREDEEVVRQSWRTVRTNLSANAFAVGEATGVRMVLMPIEASTASQAAMNLVSR